MMDRLTALFDRRPETAEDWLARMGRARVSARDVQAFQAWLEADDARLEQYQAAKAAVAGLEPLRGAFAGDLARLGPRRAPKTVARGRLVFAGGAAAAAAALALAWPLLPGGAQGRLYESPAGQITDVVLADGTRATLDAGSAVRVAFADDVRRVELERGAAYFEVAHDAAHPFQVAMGDRRVIVTGTRFVTAFEDEGAEVSVLRGGVGVGLKDAGKRDALAGAERLGPGDRLFFRPGTPGVRRARGDVETLTAWRDRRLVFRDAPLSEVAAQAGRYAGRTLVVEDPALARTRVTAVLPLEGEGTLIERMDRLLPVTIEDGPDGRAVVRAEDGHRRAVTPSG